MNNGLTSAAASSVWFVLLICCVLAPGCGTLWPKPVTLDNGPGTEELALFYWDTPEYRAYASTLPISPDEAQQLARDSRLGGIMIDHYVIVDRFYVFTHIDKQIPNILQGIRVDGHTGEVTRCPWQTELSPRDLERRFPGREIRGYAFGRPTISE